MPVSGRQESRTHKQNQKGYKYPSEEVMAVNSSDFRKDSAYPEEKPVAGVL